MPSKAHGGIVDKHNNITYRSKRREEKLQATIPIIQKGKNGTTWLRRRHIDGRFEEYLLRSAEGYVSAEQGNGRNDSVINLAEEKTDVSKLIE